MSPRAGRGTGRALLAALWAEPPMIRSTGEDSESRRRMARSLGPAPRLGLLRRPFRLRPTSVTRTFGGSGPPRAARRRVVAAPAAAQ